MLNCIHQFMVNKFKGTGFGLTALFEACKTLNNDEDKENRPLNSVKMSMSEATKETNFKRAANASIIDELFGEDSQEDDAVFGSTKQQGDEETSQYQEYSDVDNYDGYSSSVASSKFSTEAARKQTRKRRIIDDGDDEDGLVNTDEDSDDNALVIVRSNSNNKKRSGKTKATAIGRGKKAKAPVIKPKESSKRPRIQNGPPADSAADSVDKPICLVPPERLDSFRVPPYPQNLHNVEKYQEDDEDAASADSASPITGMMMSIVNSLIIIITKHILFFYLYRHHEIKSAW